MNWHGDRLKQSVTPGARVEMSAEAGWRLSIPAGPGGRYRLAELDDYRGLRRRSFPWNPPYQLSLRARASAGLIPGTWGFGVWNDPFGMGILSQAGGMRLPVLPNAAWFFFASPPNSLSLRDDLPAQGALAATYRSIRLALGAAGIGVACPGDPGSTGSRAPLTPVCQALCSSGCSSVATRSDRMACIPHRLAQGIGRVSG